MISELIGCTIHRQRCGGRFCVDCRGRGCALTLSRVIPGRRAHSYRQFNFVLLAIASRSSSRHLFRSSCLTVPIERGPGFVLVWRLILIYKLIAHPAPSALIYLTEPKHTVTSPAPSYLLCNFESSYKLSCHKSNDQSQRICSPPVSPPSHLS